MEKKWVFVSHSKKDIERVNSLVDKLKKNNYDVSRSSHSQSVDTTYIERASAFVVCLSNNYSTEDSCHAEFLMLHWQEKPIIPVILDSVSWPPGDNMFIHRDFFWSLNSLVLDLFTDRGSEQELVSRLNSALGVRSENEESWEVGNPRQTAPSPAALSSAQQKARDNDILAQLAAQSAQYQNLASAPAPASGRDRSRSSTNYINQSFSTRGQSARSRFDQSSSRIQDSRRGSQLTITTIGENEGGNGPFPQVDDNDGDINDKVIEESVGREQEKSCGNDMTKENESSTKNHSLKEISNRDAEKPQQETKDEHTVTSSLDTRLIVDKSEVKTSEEHILNPSESPPQKAGNKPNKSKSCTIL